MFNGMKHELKIPTFFPEMSITSFYKNKGLRSELRNERGVFNVIKLRSILDKLMYRDTYPSIDKNLSCSNVGGRKGRNIRDHLFVLYGIINEVKNGDAKAIDIQGYDINKCFDEMDYTETHNDLWDVGVKNDLFAMIAKLDENAKIVVKTPSGTTDKFELSKIVMQGTVFAPIKCSIQIDTLGRDCLANGDALYEYKSIVDVPVLAMVDDILGVASCSDESVKLNAIINSKIESKKLRLSDAKCFKIHISKQKKECLVKLKVHDDEIKDVKTASYLGDIINENGTIDDTIKSRADKSIGKTSQIISILSSVSLGMFYMDIALNLREAIFLNGILTNAEAWYNVKEEHLKILEAADNELMRKLLNAHSKTACELLFLETGKIPIRHIISKKRFMYLWHILKQNDDQLIKKVYDAQKIKCTKGDWYETIQHEKDKYGIAETDEEISKLSKNKFRKLVENKVNSHAFNSLKQKAASHSKSLNILDEVKNQGIVKRRSYLKENTLSRSDCQLLFQLRTKMLDVKANFSNMYNKDLTCRTCKEAGTIENEDHILQCEILKSEIENSEVSFDYVFKDLKKQILAVKTFKSVLRKREVFLRYQESKRDDDS